VNTLLEVSAGILSLYLEPLRARLLARKPDISMNLAQPTKAIMPASPNKEHVSTEKSVQSYSAFLGKKVFISTWRLQKAD
jgi:hypothetical protein